MCCNANPAARRPARASPRPRVIGQILRREPMLGNCETQLVALMMAAPSAVGSEGRMRNRLKFYLNLALFGFTVGKTYTAFQRRVAKSQMHRGRPG